MLFLFESADKAEYSRMRFEAGIHGVDLEGEVRKTTPHTESPIKKTPKEPHLFGDPASYEHLSKEEREKLTQKMKSYWLVKSGEMFNKR